MVRLILVKIKLACQAGYPNLQTACVIVEDLPLYGNEYTS